MRTLDPDAGAFQLMHTDEDEGAHSSPGPDSVAAIPGGQDTDSSPTSGSEAQLRTRVLATLRLRPVTDVYVSWNKLGFFKNLRALGRSDFGAFGSAEYSAFDCGADGMTCFCGDKDGDLRVLDLRAKDGAAGKVRLLSPGG